ncbi:MAG: S-layer homology domain-containing protein [Oscillospiraceae bacterium]|nr:S-layer homology domain-containing protein [Oscillospiraceae bacterium]
MFDAPDFRFVPDRGEQATPGSIVGDVTESPGAVRFVPEENSILWNSVPHAQTRIFVFADEDETNPDDAVGYAVVAPVAMDYSGANAMWNQRMSKNLSEIPNLTVGETYFARIQAVPSPNSPIRGVTPAMDWGASSALSVPVSFVAAEASTPSELPFVDVPADAWYRDAVAFVIDRGIMQGTSATTFEPSANLSRAVVTTILYRMAGEPEVTYRPIFGDVASGGWYSDAVTWAFDAGVVTGFDANTFAPSVNITREQFAAMMFRFAQYNDETSTVPASFTLAQFTDHGNVSAWAREAVLWSVYNELLVTETPTTLGPQEAATRAQAAVMLMRYIQAFVD